MKKINKIIESQDWEKRWAGSYTFISSSYWAKQYKYSLEKEFGIGFNKTLFIHRKGTVSFFVVKDELDNFGKTLAKTADLNIKEPLRWCKELKNNTNNLNKIMIKIKKREIPTYKEYKKFLFFFEKHLPYHNAIKKTIDYLSPSALDKLLPTFKDARVYSESIYSETELFFRTIMQHISKKEGYSSKFLTCLTQEEFEGYIVNKLLPLESKLKSRFELSYVFFCDNYEYIETGENVQEVEMSLLEKLDNNQKEIKGVTAYGGVVKGVVRVITDPHNIQKFEKGDILVTGMTRPEFIPIIKIASAIITDAGGTLCHAAITAREFKLPCIVGTQIATYILKTGDKIIVDATNGLVKKV